MKIKYILPFLYLLIFSPLSFSAPSHAYAMFILENDALISGRQVVWDFDKDFEITPKQINELSIVPSGHTALLAAQIVAIVNQNNLTKNLDEKERPIVFDCAKPNIVLVTRSNLKDFYAKKNCVYVENFFEVRK